jgi:hypothetical protein
MEAAVSVNSRETSERRRKVDVGGTQCGLRWSGGEFWGWHASHPQNPLV